MERAEVLNKFFASAPATPPKSQKEKAKTENEEVCAVGENQV